MSKELSKEHFIGRLEAHSLILNPPPNDPKTPPRSSRAIYGLNGMKAELNAILAKGVDRQGRYRGRLEYRRAMAKKARESWNSYRESQPNLPSDTKPLGKWAEDIAYCDAKVAVLEKEARTLNKLIAEAERKEAEERRKRKNSPRLALSGKLRNGILIEFAGRPVEQRDGKNYFADGDKEIVDDYIARAKQEIRLKRREQNAKRHTA